MARSRGGRIPGVFDRRATQPGGMHRRSQRYRIPCYRPLVGRREMEHVLSYRHRLSSRMTWISSTSGAQPTHQRPRHLECGVVTRTSLDGRPVRLKAVALHWRPGAPAGSVQFKAENRRASFGGTIVGSRSRSRHVTVTAQAVSKSSATADDETVRKSAISSSTASASSDWIRCCPSHHPGGLASATCREHPGPREWRGP